MTPIEKVIRLVKRRLVGLEISEYKNIKKGITNRVGLEIGGPSAIFKPDNLLPLYADIERVDGVNFSTHTVWENVISKGLTYDYGGKTKGYQFIKEASLLDNIADEEYDFILSSHSLEHCANVIKTVQEWKRVLKGGGLMVIVVPDKRYTFDQKRPITTFKHLVDDYEKSIDETDTTHLDEIILLHDLNRDPGIKGRVEFRERSLKNYENRCLHHHVFDIGLLTEVFAYLNMQVTYTGFEKPHHIIVIAKKDI